MKLISLFCIKDFNFYYFKGLKCLRNKLIVKIMNEINEKKWI